MRPEKATLIVALIELMIIKTIKGLLSGEDDLQDVKARLAELLEQL